MEHGDWNELENAKGSLLTSKDHVSRDEISQPLQSTTASSHKFQLKIPGPNFTGLPPKSSNLDVLCEAIELVSKIDMLNDTNNSNVAPGSSTRTGHAKNTTAGPTSREDKPSTHNILLSS